MSALFIIKLLMHMDTCIAFELILGIINAFFRGALYLIYQSFQMSFLAGCIVTLGCTNDFLFFEGFFSKMVYASFYSYNLQSSCRYNILSLCDLCSRHKKSEMIMHTQPPPEEALEAHTMKEATNCGKIICSKCAKEKNIPKGN